MVSRVLPSDVFRREELATLPFKETPAASNRPAHHSATGKIDQGVGTAIPESGEPKAISPANANAVKEVPATALSTDGDENQASGPTRIINVTGRDTWPLRAEWISAIHAPEAETPLSGALPAHRTQAIIEQIMDARQGMQGDFGRIRILLTPPNLGTVDLQILMRRDRVEVIMMADNAGVQQALLSRTEDIRAALQRQDIKIETFEVLLQDRSADQRQAGSGAMFDHQQEREDKQFFMDSDPLLRAAVAISPGNDLKPDGGQVSIFV
jgi:flagellar hook-length control protein FliK